jgi:DNA polymerase-3 subunit beta
VRFRIEKDTFAEAIAWVSRTLPARPAKPVLSGIVLTAGDDGVSLASFDYDTASRVHVEAVVTTPGHAVVPGRLAAEIARSLPNAPVEVSVEGSRVQVTCGRSSFTLPTLPHEEYPALPDSPPASGSLPGSTFAAAVAQVAVAAGRDDTLAALTGVRIEITGSTITLAATDRYRLAVREFAWVPTVPGAEAQVLVPARALADIAKALSSAEAVHLGLGSGDADNLLGFEGLGRSTTTRLLDADFPKYRSLLPSEWATTASLSTAALTEAVKRVALVAERNTALRLTFADSEVVLRAGTGDEAQATEALECHIDGPDIEIALNPSYLLDGLGVLDAPVARLAFTQPNRPVVLTGAADVGSAAGDVVFHYLLMPVRLAG